MNTAMPHATIVSGDTEIDQAHAAIAQAPTNADTFARRLLLLATWWSLLQRQGVDLEPLIPLKDAMEAASADEDRLRLFALIDQGYARCADLQRAALDHPPTAIAGALEPTPPVAHGRPWSVYGGDVHHTASTPESGPACGRIAWQFPVGLAWYARPLVVEGRVYVASPGMRDLLHCLDLATGELLWRTHRPWSGERATGRIHVQPSAYVFGSAAATPVLVEGGTLVLNELGPQSLNFAARSLSYIDAATGALLRRTPAGQADYRVGYAALAANDAHVVIPTGTQRLGDVPAQVVGANRLVCQRVSDGETLWDFHLGPLFAEPVVDGDQAFVGTADGVFSCVNITGASGHQQFGFSDRRRLAWTVKLGGATNASAEVTADRVYVGANDGCVYALDRATGATVWQAQVDEPEPRSFRFATRPLLVGDRLYVGTSARRVHCLDAASGQVRWSFETTDWLRARPAMVGDCLLVAAMDGTLTCLRDGEVLWTRTLGTHPVYADLVAADGLVLVSASNLVLWALDVATGAVRWRHHLLPTVRIGECEVWADELGCGGFYQSKPTAADGLVFIGTPSRFVHALDADSGRERWRYEMGAAVSGAPAHGGGRVYVGQQGGEEHFYAIDAETGLPVWKQTLGWVWSSATFSDGRLYIPGVDGCGSCLDAATGHILWRYRTGKAAHPEPPVDEGRVFFGSWDHYMYALDAITGAHLWQYHTGGSPDSGAPIAWRGRLYVPRGGQRLSCLDAATGRQIWEYPITTGCMNASPALWNGRLYVSVSVRAGSVPLVARIRCLDAADGRLIWEHSGGGITGPAVADGKVYFGSTSDHFFRCVDAEGNGDGTTACHWRVPMADRVYESVPCLYGGKAFILSEGGYLYAFE